MLTKAQRKDALVRLKHIEGHVAIARDALSSKDRGELPTQRLLAQANEIVAWAQTLKEIAEKAIAE